MRRPERKPLSLNHLQSAAQTIKLPTSFCSTSRAARPTAPMGKLLFGSVRMPSGTTSPVWLSVIDTLNLFLSTVFMSL